MEQLIRSVTTSITSQLSGNKSFYTPDDLREYDIPEFLIQRVEVEIYRNLNESIVPPQSEWADMAEKEVEQAWEQFIDAIVAEVRMPASFATTVFETAIADVMEMILQPRKAIPEILFGPKKKLSIEEVEKRLSFISVNSHLAHAIYKYMKRKGLDEIEIGTARRVIIKVDERITANYNSLNWAQLLQPLFILTGPKIDTELFRIFFKDRNMDRISRRFDLLSGSLNKTEFIETLSSPDLLNEEGYDDDQVSLFDVQSNEEHTTEGNRRAEIGLQDSKNVKKDMSAKNSQEKDDVADSINTDKNRQSSETIKSEQPTEDDESTFTLDISEVEEDEHEVDDDSILGSFQSQLRSIDVTDESEISDVMDDLKPNTVDNSDEDFDSPDTESVDTPLYVRFDTDEESNVDLTEEEEPEKRFVDQFIYDDESDQEDSDSTDAFRNDELYEGPNADEIEEASENQTIKDDLAPETSAESDEESPIWQAFLGDDDNIEEEDIPEYSTFSDLEDHEMEGINKEDEEDEAPLIDLTVLDDEVDSADHLIGWLKDDEERFTSHIFSGSEKAYEEALVDLNQLQSWNQASRFIEKEIFARNLVDMYDEEAVDFTDRLQAYFDEYKS